MKTLDFDRNFFVVSFGGDEAFCPQVHKDISLSKREGIRIVRDRPAVLDKRVLDDVVINVWSRHIKNLYRLTPLSAIIRFSIGPTPLDYSQFASKFDKVEHNVFEEYAQR